MANENNGCENIENRAGTWNDGRGTRAMYFLCESSTWESEMEFQYVGCYHDAAEDGTRNSDGSPRRSLNGVNQALVTFTNGNTADPYFQMGPDASPAKCGILLCGGAPLLSLRRAFVQSRPSVLVQ